MLIEVSVPSDFGLNNAEIKKMNKYQKLKNELKRSWNLKSTKIGPVIIGEEPYMIIAAEQKNDEEEPYRDLKNHPWEY